jgi:hypothetical protein
MTAMTGLLLVRTPLLGIALGLALGSSAARAIEQTPATEPLACESVAALVDGAALDTDSYALLDRAAEKLDHGLYQDAPIDGGRYWTRADFADGVGAAPYPHYGCFADIRYLMAWFCQADKGWVSHQWGCVPRRRTGTAERAPSGCARTRLSLREPIIYCAPGHSPRMPRRE